MIGRFVLSAPAARDLEEILTYVLEHDGPKRAQYVAERLYEAFQNLADSPGIGHCRKDLTPAQLRFWAVWSFLVVYKSETKPLEIVRVLHGAREIAAILEKNE